MRQRISEIPKPNHAQITNDLQNGKRITAEIVANKTESLRVQIIPFWKVRDTLYHLLERTNHLSTISDCMYRSYTRVARNMQKLGL